MNDDPAVVLDSGVLDRATTNPEFRRALRKFVDNGCIPIVPTVVLAEAISGRRQDAAANQTVKRVGTVHTDEPTARRAGALRFQAARSGTRRPPSAVDAIVAAHAAAAGSGFVLTTDPTDLELLLSNHPTIHVVTPAGLDA
jgi:predicted nucleic acid-binding protein